MDNVFKLKTEDPYNIRQISEFSWPVISWGSYIKGLKYIILGTKYVGYTAKKLRNIENLENAKKEIWKGDLET